MSVWSTSPFSDVALFGPEGPGQGFGYQFISLIVVLPFLIGLDHPVGKLARHFLKALEHRFRSDPVAVNDGFVKIRIVAGVPAMTPASPCTTPIEARCTTRRAGRLIYRNGCSWHTPGPGKAD